MPWYKRVKINRKAVVSINRIRCNHNSLNCSLNRFNIVKSDMCKCNESQDTPDHIFWQCRRFNRERRELVESLSRLKIFPPYSIALVIGTKAKKAIIAMANLINKIDIRI